MTETEQLRDIFQTKSINGFRFDKIHNIENSAISIALDLKGYNTIIFNEEKKSFVTIYHGETPDVAKMILCVNDAMESYTATMDNNDIYETDNEYRERLTDYLNQCSITSSTYYVFNKNPSVSNMLVLKDMEDLDILSFDSDVAIEIASTLLNVYFEGEELRKKRCK